MPKNPEEKKWAQLNEQEKEALDKELEQKQKEPKVTGLERLEARRRIAEGIEEKEQAKMQEEQETAQKKAEAEKELDKAYPKPTDKEKEKATEDEEFKKYIDQNLPERLEEKKKTWQEEEKKINEKVTPKGEELTEAEKRSLERNLYLEELSGYSIDYEGDIKGTLRGFFTGKEKARILKDGKPVEKEGKPLEFRVNWAWKHPEQDMLDFLKSEITDKIRTELKSEWLTIKTQEEVAAREAAEKEKVATQKEGVEVKEGWKGIDFKRMEAEGVFKGMKKMNVNKNMKDITGIVREYYSSETPLPADTESLLEKYDQLRPRQYKFEEVKGTPKSLKEWITNFLTGIKNSEKLKKLRETRTGAEEKEGKPREKTDGVKLTPESRTEELKEGPLMTKEGKGVESQEERLDWLEDEIKRMNEKEVPQSIRKELRQYLIENGISEDKINEMIPKEALLEAKRIYRKEATKQQDTKQQGENPTERIPEILSDLDEEESRGRPIKNKRKIRGKAEEE